MSDSDIEALAVRAVHQARLLTHRADLAAKTSTAQAVALLLRTGMSHRDIAKVTGLSKSDVSRRALTSPPLGVAQAHGSDDRVYAFADEWIWGSREAARSVVNELLRHGEEPGTR